jgi:hypothetical protein
MFSETSRRGRVATAFRKLTIAVGALVVVACGGGSDAPTTPLTPAGFSVVLSANSLSVAAGSSGTISASITRTGSFSGTVSLSAEGVPAGITVSVSPTEIVSGTTSATATVNVASTVAPGTYSFTVREKAPPLADQTGTVSVTVLAAPAFALSLGQTSLTLQAGTANVTTSVFLARTNFSDAIALTVEGAPTGVTATFANASVSGDSTQLTLTALATTAPGTYPITVRAKSALADRTALLTFSVTAPQDFALSLAPTTLSVVQLATSPPATVSIARSGGFAGAVALTLENLPTGVTGTFTTPSVTGASTQLTFNATAAASAGLTTITIRGKAAGLADRIATLPLTVSASGSFTLSLPSAAITVPQGQSIGNTITIARTAPFTGAVALSVTGLPSGVTASSPTIAAGAASATLTITASAIAATVTSSLVVHATASGVAEQTASLNVTVSAVPTSLISQHMLVQQGFAIALASTVLQSQIQVLLAVSQTGQGSASNCSTLPGGGSTQSLPVGVDNPKKAGIYYDDACVRPYILANATTVTTNQVTGRIDITENASYYGPTGTTLGTMALQEHANFSDSTISVAGLGTFIPASGATPVQLGLTCSFTSNTNATYPCYGGITQNVPSLSLALGSVTVLNLHITDPNSPVTFSGNNSVLKTGAFNALTLGNPTELTLGVTGGSSWGSSIEAGGAATFSLFPPAPTGWTVTDAGHDMNFAIQVMSNTARNLTGSITQISTSATLATFTLDQSGTGTITWSDGTTAAVTSWLFAN